MQYTTGDAQNLSAIPDNSFDLIISFETIEHLKSMDLYVNEMWRIQRPGGHYLVSTPDRRIGSALQWLVGKPQNPFHVRELSESEFAKLLEAKFEIEGRYGQAFVSRFVVFWPIQVAIKAFCRVIGGPALSNFRDQLYSNGGKVEVLPANDHAGIPKFWVMLCKKR